MKIFITGGLGVLGRAVWVALSAEHELFWFDNYSDPDDIIHNPDHCQVMDISTHNAFMFQCAKHNPDVVIHLAEVASIDPLMHSSSLRSNIVGTAQVLQACAMNRIHCLMGTWNDVVKATDLPSASIVWRQQLIPYYNKGNTVITEIKIPRVISVDLPSHSWGAIIRRFVNHAELNAPFSCDESEYTTQPINWCSLSHVSETFKLFLKRNTRTPQYPTSAKATIDEVVGFLLDIYEREMAIMSFPYSDARVFLPIKDPDHLVYQWLEEEIDAFRNRTDTDAHAHLQQGGMGPSSTGDSGEGSTAVREGEGGGDKDS
jgi:hypothetical protein